MQAKSGQMAFISLGQHTRTAKSPNRCAMLRAVAHR